MFHVNNPVSQARQVGRWRFCPGFYRKIGIFISAFQDTPAFILLTGRFSLIAQADSPAPYSAPPAWNWPRRLMRLFLGRLCYKRTFNRLVIYVRFAPESGHPDGYRKTSAFDPKRTFGVSSNLAGWVSRFRDCGRRLSTEGGFYCTNLSITSLLGKIAETQQTLMKLN